MLLRAPATAALLQLMQMPRIACYCDRYWMPLDDCRLPGATQQRLPFVCPMDYVLDPISLTVVDGADGPRSPGPGILRLAGLSGGPWVGLSGGPWVGFGGPRSLGPGIVRLQRWVEWGTVGWVEWGT
eukprot:20198-Chlamydomonas_euryale.AAC.5